MGGLRLRGCRADGLIDDGEVGVAAASDLAPIAFLAFEQQRERHGQQGIDQRAGRAGDQLRHQGARGAELPNRAIGQVLDGATRRGIAHAVQAQKVGGVLDGLRQGRAFVDAAYCSGGAEHLEGKGIWWQAHGKYRKSAKNGWYGPSGACGYEKARRLLTEHSGQFTRYRA